MNTEATNSNLERNQAQRDALGKAVRRTALIAFFVLAIVVIAFYLFYTAEKKKQADMMELQRQTMSGTIMQRDSVINEWLITFDEIEKNIAEIRQKEKLITINSKDIELTKSKKELILEDIKAINMLLDQNKKKIAALTAQLTKSGGTIKALQTRVSELETEVKQSETEIGGLKDELVKKNFEITQLNTEVDGMKETIVKKDSVITEKVNALNKAFYVSGTSKELRAKGLLTREGGFIGLGKTEKISGSLSDTAFTQIDITRVNSILINSKSAKLISEHPNGSYSYIRDTDKKILSLEILDPAAFWKISKYAVIEVTR